MQFYPKIICSFSLGEVSMGLLDDRDSWSAATTLVKVVEEVTKLLDNPSIDYIKYPGMCCS